MRLNGLNNDIVSKVKIAIQDIVGEDYEWTDANKKVHSDLMYYFHGHNGGLDLNKGVALVGRFGVGKSTIFDIWHKFLRKHYPFRQNLFIISSLEQIINDINKGEFIDRMYCYNAKENVVGSSYNDPKHLLINEFGHSYNIKSYGTDINELFEAFMMVRYDIFQKQKKLTHITTNYGTDELERKFHPKLVDRFKEMFNIVELKGNSYRNLKNKGSQ